jgi:hypothetical protein
LQARERAALGLQPILWQRRLVQWLGSDRLSYTRLSGVDYIHVEIAEGYVTDDFEYLELLNVGMTNVEVSNTA